VELASGADVELGEDLTQVVLDRARADAHRWPAARGGSTRPTPRSPWRPASREHCAAALAAQPFAVEQVGAGQLRPELGAAEPVDRFAVERPDGLTLAQQRL